MGRDKQTECYDCKFMVRIPGDTHIGCVKPDLEMDGVDHGKRNGWFMYPLNFDPTWKLVNCRNFEKRGSSDSKKLAVVSGKAAGTAGGKRKTEAGDIGYLRLVT